jgi:hypothetical protein
MLAPLVHPQALIVAFVIFPVHGHVGQEVGCTEGLEDVPDVVICAAVVAVGFVTAVAAVGPKVVRSDVSKPRCGRVAGTHHRPWMVQASSGPVGGLVSQNCVCSI